MYDFKQLQHANASIKTTNVQGKDYAEVNQRIKAFRSICPGGSIMTEMISCQNGVCIFKATVCDEDMKVLGTGTAYEKEGSSFINKTSYIENCETSAVGRALGMCGFGIDTSIASSEEVQNAILNQGNSQQSNQPNGKQMSPRDMLSLRLKELGIDPYKYATDHNLKGETNPEVFLKCLKELERR
jgi:hypothetical protein